MASGSHLWAAEDGLNTDTELPTLSSDTARSTEGYFVLNWAGPSNDPQSSLLEQSNSPDFNQNNSRKVPASGAITLTGLADGTYFFRLQSAEGVYSNTVKVQVNHHPLQRAQMIFFLGLTLFLTLCLSIYLGHQSSARETADG